MAEIFSNQLKAVLFLGNIEELMNLHQEDGYTIQNLDYQSFRSRDKLGLPYGPSNASLANITLRCNADEYYKEFYNILKRRENYSFSILYNVKYNNEHIVESFNSATVISGYIVELEEIFDTHHKKGAGTVFNIRFLLREINYICGNVSRRLVVNS